MYFFFIKRDEQQRKKRKKIQHQCINTQMRAKIETNAVDILSYKSALAATAFFS